MEGGGGRGMLIRGRCLFQISADRRGAYLRVGGGGGDTLIRGFMVPTRLKVCVDVEKIQVTRVMLTSY